MASRTEANGNDRLLHYLDLNEYGLEDVSDANKAAAKQEVADYLEEEILRNVSDGISPVRGEGRFRTLSPEYAVKEKGGRRTADLENDGDLKDSLAVRVDSGSFITAGHRGEQVPKADGHNQLSTKAKNWARQSGMPKRRYIPDDGQAFSNTITGGIRRIIEQFQSTTTVTVQDDDDDIDFFNLEDNNPRPVTTVNNPTSRGNDLFGDDVISELLQDAFRRRGF